MDSRTSESAEPCTCQWSHWTDTILERNPSCPQHGDHTPEPVYGDILFMVWNHDTTKKVLAFGADREEAKRKAHNILGGDRETYTVEPLTAPGVGVYLAGALSEVHA